MRFAMVGDGKRDALGKRSTEIFLPPVGRNISTIDIAPERQRDQVANILPVASTALDEDFLAPCMGWSGGATRCRDRQHKIGVSCLTQIDIGKGTPVAANWHLTTSCKQRLEQREANDSAARVSHARIDQLHQGILSIKAMFLLSCRQEQCT